LHIIKKYVIKNAGWKLLSCVLALALWVLVMTIIDPFTTENIPVRLSLENKNQLTDNGYVILNESVLLNTTITVSANGRTSKLNELKNDSFISYVDLKPVDLTYESRLGVNQPVSVYTELIKTDFSEIQLSWSPRVVTLRLDKIVSESFPVTVDKTDPADEDSYLADVYCRPETITVTGPRSYVNTIGSVRVAIDLENESDSVTITAEPRVYDGNNSDITGQMIEIFPEYVEITAPIFIHARMQLAAESSGSLPADHFLSGLHMDITSVEVFGPREDIAGTDTLVLPPVDLTDRTESFSVEYDINELLSGTRLIVLDDAYKSVTVTVEVERFITKTIEIPYDSLVIIGEEPGASVGEKPGNIFLTVKGMREVINPLNAGNITATLDLSGLTEGEHDIPIRFNLPDNVSIESPEPFVKIILAELELQEIEPQEVELQEIELQDLEPQEIDEEPGSD